MLVNLKRLVLGGNNMLRPVFGDMPRLVLGGNNMLLCASFLLVCLHSANAQGSIFSGGIKNRMTETCPISEFTPRSLEVNDVCCPDPDLCAAGLPDACDLDCAVVFLNCALTQQFSVQALGSEIRACPLKFEQVQLLLLSS